tara:strand:- start:1649 stop:4180 length:2532 start_codon:yes stop_codon:yes gene_type:complete
MFLRYFSFILLVFISSQTLLASQFNWECLESNNFRIYFKPERRWLANYYIQILEKNRPWIFSFVGNKTRKTVIRLDDGGIQQNGYASPLNKMMYLTQPPASTEFTMVESWYQTLAVHELTHISQLLYTQPLKLDVLSPLFYPQTLTPFWFIEGLGVYAESRLSPYSGRLNDGYYRALVLSQVAENKSLSLGTISNPLFNYQFRSNVYIYGSEFVNYLTKEYSEKQLRTLLNYLSYSFTSNFLGLFNSYYGISRAFKRTYNHKIEDAYKDFLSELKNDSEAWSMAGNKITSTGWHKYDLKSVGNKLYYISKTFSHPSPMNYYAKNTINEYDIDLKSHKTLLHLPSTMETPIQPFNNDLYFLEHRLKRGYGNISVNQFGNESIVRKYSLDYNQLKTLTHGQFVGLTVLADDHLLLFDYPEHQLGTTIWEYKNKQTTKRKTIEAFLSEGVSLNNTIYVIARYEGETWNLYSLDPKSFELTPVIRSHWKINYLAANSDNTLSFTMNENGHYRVYQFDPQKKNLLELTNSSFAKNGTIVGSAVFYTGIHASGEDIYQQEPSNKKTALPQSSPPIQIIDQEITELDYDKNGLSKSLSMGIIPHTILPGVVTFTDDLDLVNFSVYGTDKIAGILINSQLFSPLSFDFQSLGSSIFFGMSYPLFVNTGWGLNNIGLSVQSNFKNTTYLIANSLFTLPYYSKFFSSQYNTVTQTLEMEMADSLITGKSSSLIVRSGYYNSIDPFKIRGYTAYDLITESVYSINKKSIYVSAEWYKELLSINKGFWTPTIGVGSLFGSVFYDRYLNDKTYQSYGAGLTLELQAILPNLRFIIGLYGSYIKDNIYPQLQFSFQL